MEEDKKKPKIVRLTIEDILNDYHNVHLKGVVSARINLFVYAEIMKGSKEGEKTVIEERPQQIGVNPNGTPIMTMVKIKAIDALREDKKNLEQNERILRAIAAVEKEEGITRE